MDEATLTIRFKDESSVGPAGVATTSPFYSGSDPGTVKVADQQNAITQAGGVGAMAAKNQGSGGAAGQAMAPVPPAAPLAVPPINVGASQSGDPLLQTTRQLIGADPNVTVAELQKFLGIPTGRAQELFAAASVPPGGQAAPTTPLAVPPSSQQPTPPADDLNVLIARNRRLAQEESDRLAAQDAALRPPPAPVTPPPQIPGMPGAPPVEPNQESVRGVQSAVNSIAHLAQMGGPLGSAFGGVATAAAGMPGVGAAIASSAPALAVAGPVIAAAAAALAVPAAGALTLSSIAQTARGQIQGLSPEVAAAEAEANVRTLMANLRTSRRLGDEVSDFIATRSRASSAAQGIRDTFAEPLIRDFNNIQNVLATGLEQLDKTINRNQRFSEGFGWGFRQGLLRSLDVILPGTGIQLQALSALGGALPKPELSPGDNPLTFYKNMPMPTLPAPFEEGGFVAEGGSKIEFSRMPGLGM